MSQTLHHHPRRRLGLTLAFYVARRFLAALGWCLLGIFALILLFDLIELMRRSGGEDHPLSRILAMGVLHAPSVLRRVAPFAVLLAAMWTFGRLARSSELVVTRAAGVSAWQVLTPAVLSATFAGAIGFAAIDPLASAMLDRFERLEARYFKHRDSLLAVSAEGLWLRQVGHGDAASRAVIHAGRASGDGTELGAVSVLRYDGSGRLIGRIEAETARLLPGQWQLTQAREWQIGGEGSPLPRRQATMMLPTELTPARIQDSFARPDTISVWRLPAFIHNLEEQGFTARRHRLHWHMLLAMPLTFAAMALIGGAFSMRHIRFGGAGTMVLGGALAGFAAYFIFDIAQALGGSGAVPIVLAAWGPPVAALLLAASMILQAEDS